MSRSVVTKQAIDHVNAKEHLRGIDGATVVRVLRRSHGNGASNQPVRSAVFKIVAFAGDHFLNHLVERLVHTDGLPEIRVEGIPALAVADDICCGGVVLIEISEEQRPLVEEVVSPG